MAAASPLVRNLLLFGRTLRRLGLPVSPGQTMSFVRALELVDVGDRDQVYHAARSFLVTRRSDLRLFDAAFERFFSLHRGPSGTAPGPRRRPPPERRRERPFDVVTYMAYKARRFDREIEVADKAGTWSRLEVLQSKDFSEMTREELRAVKRLIEEMRFNASLRVTRRLVPDDKGRRVDLRRTLRECARHGGVAPRLRRRSAKVKERPVVLLADISGSMEKYSRLVLQFFYGLTHSLRNVECFVFATRLSRVTAELELKNVDRAIDRAAREVVDWAGGTRIGESLGTFNRRWSRRILGRGAVVVMVSDGWERGGAGELRREMRYLRHRCHRLIWLNPLSGRETYRPRAAGMAEALPYVDDFLPIHNLQSLEQLAAHLRSLPGRRR
jgi:uncharacterized protein with von Willebrand factor type A (vWA) domain